MTDKLVELFEEGAPDAAHARPAPSARRNCNDCRSWAPPRCRGAAKRAQSIMTDRARSNAVDRRAVLASLLAGAGAAAGADAAAREDKDPAAAHEHREHRDRCPADRCISSAAARTSSASASSSSAADWCSRSPSANFGGWSGLVMEADGKSLLAISDVGSWMTADVAYDGSRPTGSRRARLGPLLGSRRPAAREQARAGRGSRHPARWHACSAARCSSASSACIASAAFRSATGRCWRPPATSKLPAEARRMREQPGHRGACRAQGRPAQGLDRRLRRALHARQRLSHRLDLDRRRRAAAASSCRTSTASISPTRRAWPTAALLVLERYFRWTEGVKMRLRHIAASEIAPGARITGRTLDPGRLELRDRQHGRHSRAPAGRAARPSSSMISDDNFNHLLQRTLFLQFTLLDDGLRSAFAVEDREMPPSRAQHSASATSSSPATSAWSCICIGVLYRARVRPRHHASSPMWPSRWPTSFWTAVGRLWIAEDGDRIVGSIAVVDAEPGVRPAALVPAGAGGARQRASAGACSTRRSAYARQRGFTRIYLWSFADLDGRAAALRARGLQDHRRRRRRCACGVARKRTWRCAMAPRAYALVSQRRRQGLRALEASRACSLVRLLDLALELLAALGQLLVLGLHQEGVEPAAALHRLQRMRADAQPHLALQRIADQRHVDTGWAGTCAWSCSRHGCATGRTWAACPSTHIAGSWQCLVAGLAETSGHIGARAAVLYEHRRQVHVKRCANSGRPSPNCLRLQR